MPVASPCSSFHFTCTLCCLLAVSPCHPGHHVGLVALVARSLLMRWHIPMIVRPTLWNHVPGACRVWFRDVLSTTSRCKAHTASVCLMLFCPILSLRDIPLHYFGYPDHYVHSRLRCANRLDYGRRPICSIVEHSPIRVSYLLYYCSIFDLRYDESFDSTCCGVIFGLPIANRGAGPCLISFCVRIGLIPLGRTCSIQFPNSIPAKISYLGHSASAEGCSISRALE